MKTLHLNIIRGFLLSLTFLAVRTNSISQGRVVINEYMPWPGNTCGTTAEFVELLNFGPGPMNIGCYILTDGDYSITIPANTILQPGQFYLISGQDILPAPCGNIDSTVTVHLNWNTCNCTSGSIPTTGDGFLTDGGSANEQLVLLDPNLKIIDAVARSLPVETSSQITTSTASGQCTALVFDLDSMTINYETIGESAGRGNSFARKLDGDCGWVKDPQQSANATNNTPGDASDVTYSFYYLNALACPDDGSISVTVHASDYSDVFPMSYILAFDSDSDGVFESTDTYIYDTVINPNTITINNLVPGTYRLTVASVKGCYLQTFYFTILDCIIALPLKLISFNVHKNNNDIGCHWTTENSETLKKIIIERSSDGLQFSSFTAIPVPPNISSLWSSSYLFRNDNADMPFFRLRLQSQNGREVLSPAIKLSTDGFLVNRIWPNPVNDQLFAQYSTAITGIFEYKIFSLSNQMVINGTIPLLSGTNSFSIPVQRIQSGTYLLVLQPGNYSLKPARLRFVKL
ncbi:MAG TPA: lamin tail domain-containing protein [Chitinophagaceae bacterium]|nr:lamin tail domain-containing protein [Chitinophagaceae bacterium]